MCYVKRQFSENLKSFHAVDSEEMGFEDRYPPNPVKTLNPIWLPNHVTNDQSQRTKNVKQLKQQIHARFQSNRISHCGAMGRNTSSKNSVLLVICPWPLGLRPWVFGGIQYSTVSIHTQNLNKIRPLVMLLALVQKSAE